MKLFLKLAPWLLLSLFVWFLLSWVYSAGQNKIQLKWNQQKEEQRAEVDRLKAQYETFRKEHDEASNSFAKGLSDAKEDYALSLAKSRASYEQRLLNSQGRTVVYERQAEAGPTEARNLASHAAELDRTIERGRLVVEGLRDTIKLRDSQLIILGQQILADRKVLESADNE